MKTEENPREDVVVRIVDSNCGEERLKLSDFQALLDKEMLVVPDALRKSATILFEHDNFYGDTGVRMIIEYERPESDEEMADRLKRTNRKTSQQETRDRAELARLQKLYGDKLK